MKTSALLALAASLCMCHAAGQIRADGTRNEVRLHQIKAEIEVLVEHQKKVSSMMLDLELEQRIAAAQGKDARPTDKTLAALAEWKAQLNQRIEREVERIVQLETEAAQRTSARQGPENRSSLTPRSERQRLERDLELLRDELAKLHIRYKDKYPHVMRVKDRITALEKRLIELNSWEDRP
jgi:hypothetical protein